MTCNLGKPCADCAFRRDSTPGNLGGSPATKYIGQSVGPFIAPCHLTYPKDIDLDKVEWREKSLQMPQCAGMAVFRANLGVDILLPDAVHKLPQDHVAVFSTHAEFLAHHTRAPLGLAQQFLKSFTPLFFLRQELDNPRVVTRPVENLTTKEKA